MKKVIVRRRVRRVIVRGKEKKIQSLDKEKLERFNTPVLGLGDIGAPSKEVEAIAAVFDLSRFTSFCNQVDPHLAVPQYLSRFLDWLFNEVKQGVVKKATDKVQKYGLRLGCHFYRSFWGMVSCFFGKPWICRRALFATS